MTNEDRMFLHDRPVPARLRRAPSRIRLAAMDLLFDCFLGALRILRKDLPPKRYRLAICGIFKNEAPYLREWIEYHRLVGVEHFYLYNNFSDDGYLEVLGEYTAQGIVDLAEWPVDKGQALAYQDCFAKHGSEADWIAFIDLDEFIVPREGCSLPEWLGRFGKYPAVIAYWKVFGTSGNMRKDVGKLVIERFTCCWGKLDDIGKVFFNTRFVPKDLGGMHAVEARFRLGKEGRFKGKTIVIPPINEFRHFLIDGFHRVGRHAPEDATIQINHYFSKSLEEYSSKITRGDAILDSNPRTLEYFLWHEHRSTSSDFLIWRFLIELKLRLGYETGEGRLEWISRR